MKSLGAAKLRSYEAGSDEIFCVGKDGRKS